VHGSGGGDLENCAYLWKNPGYASDCAYNIFASSYSCQYKLPFVSSPLQHTGRKLLAAHSPSQYGLQSVARGREMVNVFTMSTRGIFVFNKYPHSVK